MLTNKLIKPNRAYHKKGQLQYSTKKYSNPIFNGKKGINHQNLNFEVPQKIKIFSILLSSLFLILVAVMLYSSIFMITNIEVRGEGRVGSETIKSICEKTLSQKYIKFFPNRNLLLFRTKKLREQLEDKYAFNVLNITKDYPNKIIIEYKEKPYAFVLEEGESYYYMDIDGNVVEEANILEVSRQLYPIIDNLGENKISNKTTQIDMNTINFILNVFNDFKARTEEIAIDRFILDSELKTVKIKLENGPVILFNPERGVAEQLEKLLIVKQEKIKDDFLKKEYIDLRYGDSVYYR